MSTQHLLHSFVHCSKSHSQELERDFTNITHLESLDIGSDECLAEGDGNLDHSLLVRLSEQLLEVTNESILERLPLLGQLVHGLVVFVDELVD